MEDFEKKVIFIGEIKKNYVLEQEMRFSDENGNNFHIALDNHT